MKPKIEEENCLGKLYDEVELDCQSCVDADECKKMTERSKSQKKLKSKKLKAKPLLPELYEIVEKQQQAVLNVYQMSPPKVITNIELKELHGALLNSNADLIDEEKPKETVKTLKTKVDIVGNRKNTLSGYIDSLGLVGKYTLDEMVKKLEIYNKVKQTKGDLKRRIVNHFKWIVENREAVEKVEINDNGVYKIILK